MKSLTLEDIVGAARCVALWRRSGRDAVASARCIKRAVARAHAYRRSTGAMHPTLGDGSLSAAAANMAPVRGHTGSAAVTPGEILAAMAAVSVVIGCGASVLRSSPKGRHRPS